MERQMSTLPGPNYGGYMTAGSKKYRGLYLHLSSLTEQEWSGSFSQIEQIIGNRLPPSARDHREWWSNHRGPGIHRQARSWIAAGWEGGSSGHGQRENFVPDEFQQETLDSTTPSERSRPDATRRMPSSAT